MDLIASCERLVAELRGLQGVVAPPGAAADQVFAAQESIEATFPPELSVLLSVTDGLSIDHGLRRYLPVDPRSPLNIVRFNDPTTWMSAYARLHPEVLDFVYFAVVWQGFVVGFRRDELASSAPAQARTYVVVPSVRGGVFPSAATVMEGLRAETKELRRTGALSLHPNDRAVLDMHGPLPPGKIVMPGTRDLIEGDGSLEGSYPMETVSALIAIGDLTTQLREMPEGTEVLAVEPWVDELGRTRLRWRTKQPR